MDHIIYRNYILNRRFFFLLTVAWPVNPEKLRQLHWGGTSTDLEGRTSALVLDPLFNKFCQLVCFSRDVQ